MINAGIIGYGYWGPNILRNFQEHPELEVKIVCDYSNSRLDSVSAKYPSIKTSKKTDYIFNDKKINLVAIITPLSSHYELAKKALLNNKHVFVEKPFTATSDQAKELIDLAEKKNLLIMVDHTFLFNSTVLKIKDLLDKGELGNLFYYDSIRVNLGKFQQDVNVIWDLAPHDLSILNFLINDIKPISINAIGSKNILNGQEDVAYLHLQYENNLTANLHVNWLSPVKIRQSIFAGDKKMLLWDDISNDEKIKVYDKGVDAQNKKGLFELQVNYRSGDMWSPKVDYQEALKTQTNHIVNCIKRNEKPISSGIEGLKVVNILEASEKSIKNKGMEIKITE